MQYLKHSLFLRWAIAQTVALPLSLLCGSVVSSVLYGSFLSLLLAGFVIGAGVGVGGWLALRPCAWMNRRWIVWSAVGGAMGVLPAFLISLPMLLFGFGASAALAGAVFAACVAAGQVVILRRVMPEFAWWWVGVNALGGLIGAALGLPFGSLVFGVVTGWILSKWIIRG